MRIKYHQKIDKVAHGMTSSDKFHYVLLRDNRLTAFHQSYAFVVLENEGVPDEHSVAIPRKAFVEARKAVKRGDDIEVDVDKENVKIKDKDNNVQTFPASTKTAEEFPSVEKINSVIPEDETVVKLAFDASILNDLAAAISKDGRLVLELTASSLANEQDEAAGVDRKSVTGPIRIKPLDKSDNFGVLMPIKLEKEE